MAERNRSPRAQIALPCTLRRRIGSPIVVQTVEVGPEGMCVSSPRPLAADETVTFDLPDLDIRVSGSARVTSQQRLNVYGQAGLPCPRCGTELRSRVLDGRTTTWCPTCQPGPGRSRSHGRSGRASRSHGR